MSSAELPPPTDGGAYERESTITVQLRLACLGLRSAIRSQTTKSVNKHGQRVKHQKDTNPYAKIPPVPTAAEMREVLRRTHRVAAGTGREDEHMVRHFYGVYEEEDSARAAEASPTSHIIITHVTHQTGEDEVERLQYQIKITGDEVRVYEGAGILEEHQLDQPLDIVRQARELYP